MKNIVIGIVLFLSSCAPTLAARRELIMDNFGADARQIAWINRETIGPPTELSLPHDIEAGQCLLLIASGLAGQDLVRINAFANGTTADGGQTDSGDGFILILAPRSGVGGVLVSSVPTGMVAFQAFVVNGAECERTSR